MNKDLTVGAPREVLWKFCLPLFGSIIFQQLYNIADSLVAGKFAGENALAAVGNSYEVTLIFIAFAMGCNIGSSVVVSQLFGAKEIGQLKTAVYTTFIASGVLCAALMVFGMLCSDALLKAINTPSEVMADSELYLDIYILGLPFLFFYNVSTGIFSALGDSRTPFLFLAASSLSNIFMDILFVAAFDMGVAGVAWATFICQGVSCILAVLFLLKRLRGMETDEKVPLFSRRILWRLAVIAIPSILQQSSISVGNIIIQGVINDFGTSVMAGYAAAVKLNNLVTTSFTTLGNGISNFTAQNIGAGKLPRVREGFRAGVGMVWRLCVPIVALYFIGGRIVLQLFMDSTSTAALDTGMDFLRILSPFYFVLSVKLVADGVLRGAGRMTPFMLSTMADLALRVVLVYVFSAQWGTIGIWMAWPVGWCIATVLSYACYRFGEWSRAEQEE